MTTIREFKNNEELRKIREDILNPLATKVVGNIDPRLNTVEDSVKRSFQDARLDVANKSLVISRLDPAEPEGLVDLSPIIPAAFPGMAVAGSTGSTNAVQSLTFPDSAVKAGVGSAEVSYDWGLIVPAHQEDLVVSIGDDSPSNAYGAQRILFTGNTKNVTGDVPKQLVTVHLPDDPVKMTGDAGDGTIEFIKGVRLTGEVAQSKIENEILTIHLNKDGGGGGAVTTGGNFQGFFDNLGELISTVTNPVNGRSFAFVKDKTLSNNYYDAYMYIGNSWTEVPIDPGLVYEDPTSSQKKGVFSIKPNPAITVDAKGQMNLDKLAESGNFQGFFESQAELEKACTQPLSERSFGYIRMASGAWLGKMYSVDPQTGDKTWKNIAPMGSTPVVTKGSGGSSDTTIMAYGFKDNSMISVDPNSGLVEIKEGATGSGDMTGEIVDASGAVVTVKFDKMQFMNGSSYVAYQQSNKKLLISHPQRVIQYTSDFEQDHNEDDYKGNIFYDDNTHSWMGWATPAAAGAVGNKWTRIAHEGMSQQVKDMDTRLPQKAPTVSGGTLGDDAQWEHTGWSYVEAVGKDDPSDLPSDIKQSGGYVQTYVKAISGETGIPQARMQTCYEDAEVSSQWVRMFDPNPSGSGDPSWKKWVRTSFARQDIVKHEDDPNAHRHVMKFYKATSFSAKYLEFVNQVEGTTTGGVRGENCSLLADNYGHFNEEHDYMEPPYDNTFRVSGRIAFSGYNEGKKTYPIGAWKILVRVKKKDSAEWRPAGHFNYAHSDTNKKYPLLSFETADLDLVRGDQIIININFDNNTGLKNNHPDLYFVPVRSHFVLEDKNTHAGSKIANTLSKCVANVDTMGDVGVRVHHTDPSKPTTNIRVYGEVVSHIPREMSKI